MSWLPFWPHEASAYAAEIDHLAIAFTVLVVLLSAPVFILVVMLLAFSFFPATIHLFKMHFARVAKSLH